MSPTTGTSTRGERPERGGPTGVHDRDGQVVQHPDEDGGAEGRHARRGIEVRCIQVCQARHAGLRFESDAFATIFGSLLEYLLVRRSDGDADESASEGVAKSEDALGVDGVVGSEQAPIAAGHVPLRAGVAVGQTDRLARTFAAPSQRDRSAAAGGSGVADDDIAVAQPGEQAAKDAVHVGAVDLVQDQPPILSDRLEDMPAGELQLAVDDRLAADQFARRPALVRRHEHRLSDRSETEFLVPLGDVRDDLFQQLRLSRPRRSDQQDRLAGADGALHHPLDPIVDQDGSRSCGRPFGPPSGGDGRSRLWAHVIGQRVRRPRTADRQNDRRRVADLREARQLLRRGAEIHGEIRGERLRRDRRRNIRVAQDDGSQGGGVGLRGALVGEDLPEDRRRIGFQASLRMRSIVAIGIEQAAGLAVAARGDIPDRFPARCLGVLPHEVGRAERIQTPLRMRGQQAEHLRHHMVVVRYLGLVGIGFRAEPGLLDALSDQIAADGGCHRLGQVQAGQVSDGADDGDCGDRGHGGPWG